ncbi:hypothetical protein AN644_02275 [Candidatus Epulonipiscium fishelsonii]|nr:hypothetical protein AN644_02275 [Epulopiscium sp. SCG-C06WGA-EpuloA1]
MKSKKLKTQLIVITICYAWIMLTSSYMVDIIIDNIYAYEYKVANSNEILVTMESEKIKEVLKDVNKAEAIEDSINIITPIILTVGLVLILHRKLSYVLEICDDVENIVENGIENSVRVKDNNELTILANTINELTKSLSQYIEKEHATLEKEKIFITNISHDLKSPVTSIIGYSHAILNKDLSSETVLEYTRVVYDKSSMLKNTITGLLDNYCANKIDKVASFDLIEQISLYVNSLHTDGFLVEVSTNATNNIVVSYNQEKLNRVLENIVSNARKYATDRLLQLDFSKIENYLIVSFVNPYSTTAISEFDSNKKMITLKDDKSYGMGLLICNQLMTEQDGNLKVLKTDGKSFGIKLYFKINL